MLERILRTLDRYWLLCALLLLPVLGLAAYSASQLKIEDAPEVWMPKSSLEAWKVFDRHFGAGDSIALGLEFSRPVQDSDADLLRGLRQEIIDLPGVRLVYDPALVAQEIEDVPLTSLLNSEEKERFSIYRGTLWDVPAPQQVGRTLLMVIDFEYLPPERGEELNDRRRAAMKGLYALLEQRQQQDAWQGVTFHLASSMVVMAELEKRARQVAFTFLPAALLVGLVTLLIGYRSARSLLAAVLGSCVAILLVLGFLSWFEGRLGAVTMTAPTLMSIIAIATTVHFTAYAAGHTAEPHQFRPGKKLRAKLVRWVGVPCLGAAATTGVGFLMLTFNELQPIRSLGVQLFAGALLAFLGVFLVTQWLPIYRAHTIDPLTSERILHSVQGSLQRPLLVTVLTLVCSASLFYVAWPRSADAPVGLYVDANPFSFFDEDQPIAKALNHFADRDFGMYALEVVLLPKDKGRPPEGIALSDDTYRANRQAEQAFEEELRTPEAKAVGIDRIVSTSEFRRRQYEFSQELLRIQQSEGWMAAFQKGYRVSQHMEMFNQTFQSWSRDRQNEGAVRVTVLASEQGANGFGPLVDYVEKHLPTDRFECHITGAIPQITVLSNGLVTGLAWGLGASLVVMAMLCIFLFRSLRLAAIAFLPNAFPLLAVFGLMGATKLPISSGSAMIATVALGIALNDTIHFLLHYCKLTRESQYSVRQAVEDTIRHIGRPLILTSLVHLAGFAIFLLTDFLPLYHFGLLGSVAMLAAILGDLLILPCLLLLFDHNPAGVRAPQQDESLAWEVPSAV